MRDVQTKCEGFFGVKPEADSVAAFQIFQVDVGSAGGHFSGVREHCDVQCPPGFPAILRTCENAVAVAETTFPEASQALPPTQVGHEVERYGVVAVGVGQNNVARHREDFITVIKGYVLLSVQLVASEIKPV